MFIVPIELVVAVLESRTEVAETSPLMSTSPPTVRFPDKSNVRALLALEVGSMIKSLLTVRATPVLYETGVLMVGESVRL